MTNRERHRKRYEARVAKREANLIERNGDVGDIDKVYAFRYVFDIGRVCCNNIRWKASAQNFEMHRLEITARSIKELKDGTWEPDPYNSFHLTERGKRRPIDAPTIKDRQVHKVLVRRVLIPLYSPSLIDDNGASLKGKGFHYALKKTREQMHRHFRKYGMAGWVILLDCSNFFPSANHDKLKERHARYILDDNLRRLTDDIIEANGRKVGVPLGVEVSQIEMVAAPSALDNYIRCQMGLARSGHYMDDYHIFVPPDRDPKAVLDEVIRKAEECGFHVNRAKTRILPFGRPFRYCKARVSISETGKIRISGSMRSYTVACRKIRMFARRKAEGTLDVESARTSIESSIAYFNQYDDHNRALRLARRAYAALHNIGGDIT